MDEKLLSSVLTTFYSVIFIVGLVGNIIALYVFLGIHRKRNSIQIYLLNVAIADLLLIFCLPFRIMYHINQNKWTLGVILCKIVGTLFYMNMYISIILLGFISLDRYIKINRSVQQRKAITTKQNDFKGKRAGVKALQNLNQDTPCMIHLLQLKFSLLLKALTVGH
eukprot:bmy_05067T0